MLMSVLKLLDMAFHTYQTQKVTWRKLQRVRTHKPNMSIFKTNVQHVKTQHDVHTIQTQTLKQQSSIQALGKRNANCRAWKE